MEMRALLPRIAYGGAFVVALPLLLIWWTRAVDLHPPALHYPGIGGILALIGVWLMGMGMWLLWSRGGGLPMNAFPPERHVASGIYAVIPHPIYVGFVLTIAGFSIGVGSGAGLWLTTPIVALGCVALVVGYEGPRLRERFGDQIHRPWISIPPASGGALALGERFGALVCVLGPWLIAYEGVKALGVPADAIVAQLPGEAEWPVLPWTEIPYASTYIVVPLAFLLAPTRGVLRQLAIRGVVATVLLTVVYLCVPMIAPFRVPTTDGIFTRLLWIEQAQAAPPVAAFPSFHVLWAGLVAAALSHRGGKWRKRAWAWAAIVAVSCVTTGMHALVDVIAGVACWLFFCNLENISAKVLSGAERLSNAWSARRIGPLRVINHGVYAGMAAFIGTVVSVWLSGDRTGIAIIAGTALISAGLWAQLVEGSSMLQRPFGYFGFLLGAALAGISLGLVRGDVMPTLAAICIGGTFAQAVGRLRCLVQGCCHGARTDSPLGLVVTEPHSRVCSMSHLGGVRIHATQLHSVAANLIMAALLLRLWVIGAPLAVIAGGYLLLSGLARFIEEGFRGEAQTARPWGLSLYQWMAVVSAFGGLVLAAVPSASAVPPPTVDGLLLVAQASITGVVFWFAMGVDFPTSERRFARLSG